MHILFKDDVVFALVANNGEQLNFIVNDNSQLSSSYLEYIVTESDKSVRMKPMASCISSNKWPLPRNLKIGDSREQLTKAYNGDQGVEYTAEGCLDVSYNYGQSGEVTYTFLEYDLDAGIIHFCVTWYDNSVLQ